MKVVVWLTAVPVGKASIAATASIRTRRRRLQVEFRVALWRGITESDAHGFRAVANPLGGLDRSPRVVSQTYRIVLQPPMLLVKMFKVRDKSGFLFGPLIDLPEDAAYHSPHDWTNHLALPHR